MKKKLVTLVVTWLIAFPIAHAQTAAKQRKFFVGSTFFVFANLFPDNNPPDFFQLNLGYRINPKNTVSVELKTWKYAWPLGIPYGKSFEAPEHKYPGSTRDFGIALVYQRFLWKGLYGAVHATNALQTYKDEDKQKIQNGYMLFMTYRVGYHIPLFKNRFFVEPSVAMTHWPIKTNTPESFAAKEKNWPNTFFPEPGLHFGMKF